MDFSTANNSWREVISDFQECDGKGNCPCNDCLLKPPHNVWLDYQCYCWWCDQVSVNGLYQHCWHCNCDICDLSVDGQGETGDLVVDVETKQRRALRCVEERQSGYTGDIEDPSLQQGELLSSNKENEVKFQSEFLAPSASVHVDEQEGAPSKKRRLLTETIAVAKKTHNYAGLTIFSIPSGSKIITFDENGQETCLQTEESIIGRPIRVTVSSYKSKSCNTAQPKQRGFSKYNFSNRY